MIELNIGDTGEPKDQPHPGTMHALVQVAGRRQTALCPLRWYGRISPTKADHQLRIARHVRLVHLPNSTVILGMAVCPGILWTGSVSVLHHHLLQPSPAILPVSRRLLVGPLHHLSNLLLVGCLSQNRDTRLPDLHTALSNTFSLASFCGVHQAAFHASGYIPCTASHAAAPHSQHILPSAPLLCQAGLHVFVATAIGPRVCR
mmetsp:Transcript_19769/g.35236  ORF Transcript_19769/g.35236 Transcript_19769/m.35236 type:complete len:203 (-) Transcript_19769:109-717(-)